MFCLDFIIKTVKFMKFKTLKFVLLFCIMFVHITVNSVNAAGLLAVCANNADVSQCRQRFLSFPTYRISGGVATVEYRIDSGLLGDFDSDTLETAVSEVLNIWEDVSTLDFRAQGNGFIPFDVRINNYRSILESDEPLGYSPIVFDENGEIVDDIIGAGSREDILGFAATRFFTSSGGVIQNIFESQALINGYLFRLANRQEFNNTDEMLANMKTTVLHEFAHMVGLDHSQGGQINDFIDSSLTNADRNTIPILFPVAINPSLTLQRDDIASVNIAYPDSSIISGTASISGSVTDNGAGVKAANVIAYNTSDPLGELVTSVSDIDGKGDGNFTIPNLRPGTYVLKVEPIFSDFVGGSSVGIHPPDASTLSIPSAFYNGSSPLVSGLTIDQAINQVFPITLSRGQELKNINIEIASGGGSGGNGGNSQASFRLAGRAINKLNILQFNRPSRYTLRLRKSGSGPRLISLSTEFPGLISFSRNPVRIRGNQRSRKVRVTFESFSNFFETFPEINGSRITIPISATDSLTGDTVVGELEIF